MKGAKKKHLFYGVLTCLVCENKTGVERSIYFIKIEAISLGRSTR